MYSENPVEYIREQEVEGDTRREAYQSARFEALLLMRMLISDKFDTKGEIKQGFFKVCTELIANKQL